MTPCRCERCRPDDPAPTYTRAFMLECLAREIAALPSLVERRARVERWERRHGPAQGGRLREALKREWGARRG